MTGKFKGDTLKGGARSDQKGWGVGGILQCAVM